MSKQKRGMGGLALWTVVALMALAVVALVVMGRRRASRAAAAVEPVIVTEGRILDVRVMTIRPGEARDVIELPGYLEPFAEVTVAAEKPGRILELTVEKGDRVEAGQVLMRLNSRLWQAMVEQAQVQKREADREWARWEELKDSGAVSSSDLDAVRKARDLATTMLAQAQANLSMCEIVSPIDGIVADRFMDPGEYSMEGGRILHLVDVNRLKLILDVPEQDVAAVEVGREVTFRVRAAGKQSFRGTVRFVAPAATRASNSYRSEIEVDNREGLLKAGMIASATLVRRVRDDAIVVPLSAVVPEKGEHIVFVVEEDRAVRRRVYIEAIQGQTVVLRDGLADGDQLVTAGQRGLQDGRQVKVVE
ncbi:MAG: efflux RND transporter periplasmic adaptor subunit [Verrucomicrobia bacterium]|jgi:membrane fusion protein, multidrug efflux system|nr:efflux RND transporter periplasmic adaptor subunit [Verrucomicrobiota bacterium]MBT7067546.1 efflux RND transporter periplasmic adaptor subunit [Verrucomicrobiota bacterium]MBT7698703.1 efflux RND transporter periplasmic adaptor subunit [Verrucomicrobiota bacterium]